MKKLKKGIMQFFLMCTLFAITANSHAQSDNYLFFYGEPFLKFSKDYRPESFTLLFLDEKTEKYKLDKSLAKSFKFLWQYKGNEAPTKFAVERFEFNPENDACTHEARVVLKGTEPNGIFTSKPLKGRVGSTLHEAKMKETKYAIQMVTNYLKGKGFKSATIAAILTNMTVSAISLKSNEKDSLVVQVDFEWNKKFISMLMILTPTQGNQYALGFSEIHTSEMETESVHISFGGNIDMGDGEGDVILLNRDRWENGELILLSRPKNETSWREEYSLDRGC